MKVSGWKAETFGIRISSRDRDKFFNRAWKTVFLFLEGEKTSIEVCISDSFWRNCSELRSKKIGDWFIKYRKAPWTEGNTPKMEMEHIKENIFKVTFL